MVSHNFRAPLVILHSLIDIYKEEEDPKTKRSIIRKI
jgi:hypothetical protein